jgi:hypothetical protein
MRLSELVNVTISQEVHDDRRRASSACNDMPQILNGSAALLSGATDPLHFSALDMKRLITGVFPAIHFSDREAHFVFRAQFP